ncbi:MsnO8 family LLM class oxidoreductase [Elizabethkingia argentiflava]|uniref:Luciferase-like monooxygenase n=1 Tax=Elizabethkingia argenteiflava TaxID=2681556 RepID=A0A845PYS5_9FLAO|nr:LLM class flavin-dependent oxidoreductase [Elizabethkingia argenteiflava]NAW51966.1 MsnO8 family LLM class oxidoreductase [Elizabethkingia argenteiflava]
MDLKKIKYSILDLAYIAQGNSIYKTLKHSLDLAIHAEKWGYERFWLAEHHNMVNIASSATAVLVGYIAGGTQKIRVGSGGVMLPNHSSLVVAEQFGTLETLYPGRIDLGIGRAPGTDAQTARALGRNPHIINAQFPHQISELQTYFSKENRKEGVRAIPGEGLEIPIYILGSSTDSAWLAAQLGLPYAFAGHFAPDHMAEAFNIYREHYKPSQDFPHPYVIAAINVVAAPTDEEADYLATTLFQAFLNLIRNDRKPSLPPVEDMDALWSPIEAMQVRRMLSSSLIGGESTIEKKLQHFLSVCPIDEIMVVSHIYDHQERLRSYEIFKNMISR